MLTLYTTPLSANGRKVLAVCEELQLVPRVELVDVYRGEGRTPEYLAVNPSGKIPTLVDGDLTLCESNAILQYLCEAHGAYRLWSREPAERASIARWLFWEAAHWQPALVSLLGPLVGHRLRPDAVPAPPGEPEWGSETLRPLLATLEAALATRAFLVGERLTIADFSVAGMVTYFRAAGFPFSTSPAFAAWYARIEARAAWRATEAPLWRAG